MSCRDARSLHSIVAVGLLLSATAGCVWVPDAGLVIPDKQRVAQAKTEAEAKQSARNRSAGSLVSSTVLVDAELRHHLPPPAVKGSTAERLVVIKRGGVLFGAGTFEVTATGDFTPKRIEAFVDATRRLQRHLDPAPRFRLSLFRDAAGAPIALGQFSID